MKVTAQSEHLMECEQSVIRPVEKRYYVYIGPACNERVDYADAEEARSKHPGEWVFDRVTKKPVEFKEEGIT